MPPSPVEILLLDGDQADLYRTGVAAVWGQSFDPIEDEAEWTQNIWDRHRARDDYRLAVALEDRHVVGFAWGYTGQPGQFWTDYVLRTLGDVATPWLGGHFEFVELAVAPAGRGQGVGGRLHDRLLEDLPHERAVLGTSSDPADPAVRLYLAHGWQHLGLLNEQNQVMVRRLPQTTVNHSMPAAASSS